MIALWWYARHAPILSKPEFVVVVQTKKRINAVSPTWSLRQWRNTRPMANNYQYVYDWMDIYVLESYLWLVTGPGRSSLYILRCTFGTRGRSAFNYCLYHTTYLWSNIRIVPWDISRAGSARTGLCYEASSVSQESGGQEEQDWQHADRWRWSNETLGWQYVEQAVRSNFRQMPSSTYSIQLPQYAWQGLYPIHCISLRPRARSHRPSRRDQCTSSRNTQECRKEKWWDKEEGTFYAIRIAGRLGTDVPCSTRNSFKNLSLIGTRHMQVGSR